MTEAEWLAADTGDRFRWFHLLGPRRGRLFGVACCRLLGCWPYPEVTQALDAAEAFADTGKSRAALRRGRQAVDAARGAVVGTHAFWQLFVVQVVASENATHGILPGRDGWPTFAGTVGEELRRMYPLFADIAPVGRDFDPAWRTAAVLAIAAACYAARAFDRLPVLADALEDAGCDAPELLAHLRGPGPHARGCWVLDVVLGKA